MQTYKATLTKKTTLPGTVFLLSFTLDDSQKLVFKAGQYLLLNVPQEKSPVKRLYSIASASQNTQSFELLIKYVAGGAASEYLLSLQEGAVVTVDGPAGVFSIQETGSPKIFAATGTGVAPIRSIILSNQKHTQPYLLLWGLPNTKELYLFEELKQLSLQDPLFHFVLCFSREPNKESLPTEIQPFSHIGRVNSYIELLLKKEGSSHEYYICGGREMVESLRIFLYSQNIDKTLIHFERY